MRTLTRFRDFPDSARSKMNSVTIIRVVIVSYHFLRRYLHRRWWSIEGTCFLMFRTGKGGGTKILLRTWTFSTQPYVPSFYIEASKLQNLTVRPRLSKPLDLHKGQKSHTPGRTSTRGYREKWVNEEEKGKNQKEVKKKKRTWPLVKIKPNIFRWDGKGAFLVSITLWSYSVFYWDCVR